MDAAEILYRHSIAESDLRKEILQLLMNSAVPLTGAEIKKGTGTTANRMVIFRTLQLFIKAGFVILVPSAEHKKKYSYHENTTNQVISFTCTRCKKLFFLNVPAIQPFKFPGGFKVTHISYSITGCCRNCGG